VAILRSHDDEDDVENLVTENTWKFDLALKKYVNKEKIRK